MTDRRGISFRDSAITFAFMTAVVAVLAVALLVLLDPRSQAFWGAKFEGLGTAVRAAVDQLPRLR
ncbi:MAG TPA: hypothetical protein VKR80_00945 [Candidatus Limnocylindria bacterium]|nr:hypothetical protein [Candidatus Limnocylindria bacterium]